jgi:hypothetical protein
MSEHLFHSITAVSILSLPVIFTPPFESTLEVRGNFRVLGTRMNLR